MKTKQNEKKSNSLKQEVESDLSNEKKDSLKESVSEKDAEENIIKEEDLIEKYESQFADLREEKLRILADMDNLRKRSEKEKIESIKFGSFNLARDILSLNDNLTRALDNMPNENDSIKKIKNLVDGLILVQKEFTSILERHGVKKNEALNKKFDHNFHQAMLEIETDDSDEGIVVQEIQPGYTMHDRLLRPSLVGVSKKPTKEKK